MIFWYAKRRRHFIMLILSTLLCTAATAQNNIRFKFSADGGDVVLNEIRYKSARGLGYSICQCQYFVSDIAVRYKDGTTKLWSGTVHYADIEIERTLLWRPADDFTLTNADSLYFTFGLDSVANRSYRFRNPPENLMFWPDYLGGGYHYMKTNIRYIAQDGQYAAFNCHIGRGQVYGADGEPESYIENSFRVAIPVRRDSDGNALITLDIPTIFDSPAPTLFSDYGGIMNNQNAMSLFIGNIKSAFF